MRRISLALIFTLLFSITALASADNTEGSGELPTYQQTLEGTISAYTSKEDGTVMSFRYDVPFSVHFNDTYECNSSGTITIKEVKISEDGIPIINVLVNTDRAWDTADIKGTVKYQEANGNHITEEVNVIGWLVEYGNTEITEHILGGADFDWYLRKNPDPIKSIEVWLHQ